MIIYIKQNTLIVKIASIFMRLKKGECMATSIGNKIHLLGINPSEFIKRKPFVRHEIEHILQNKRTKFFRLKYIIETIKNGYSKNKYELEAEKNKYTKVPSDIVLISDDFIMVGNFNIIKIQ